MSRDGNIRPLSNPAQHIAATSGTMPNPIVPIARTMQALLVQTQRIPDPHLRNARRATEIRQHLSDELMQLRVIDHD